ncbi:MAG: hypothetical protein OXR72_05010 [Gemmatimonadota bacterium]|nr:hypothetical protein [Gemmatimonadota bacterium]
MNIRINVNGKLMEVDAVEVGVDNLISRMSTATLNDGTVLELSIMIMAAHRAVEQWDNIGNPIYSLDMQGSIRIKHCPPALKRPTQ